MGVVLPFFAPSDEEVDAGPKSYPRMNGASSGILTDSARTAVSREDGSSSFCRGEDVMITRMRCAVEQRATRALV